MLTVALFVIAAGTIIIAYANSRRKEAQSLAGQACPCENAYCPHHDVMAFEPCPNRAEGARVGHDPIMLYLGPCCRPCAEALAADAPGYVMRPIGTATEYVG
jgi:hypothetical protein